MEALHILYCVLSVIISRVPRYQDSADSKEPVVSWSNIGRYSKEESEAVANLYYGKIKKEQEKQSDISDKWDDMLLHGDNKEHTEPALAASEVEDQVARYCADALDGPAAVSGEGLLAKEASRDRILSVVDDSQDEHTPAVEDKLINELCALTEDQLIRIQAEKTDTKN